MTLRGEQSALATARSQVRALKAGEAELKETLVHHQAASQALRERRDVEIERGLREGESVSSLAAALATVSGLSKQKSEGRESGAPK